MRNLVPALVLLVAVASTAHAFDSAWHGRATAWAAKQCGLESGIDILTVGNFAPDFFGPVYDKGKVWLRPLVLEYGLGKLVAVHETNDPKRKLRLRNAATFLHFDDLGDALVSNDRFASMFSRLLANTRAELIRIHGDRALDARTKRILVLLTLGSSLHMVQDFYSHTNWTHLAPPPPPSPPPAGLRPLPDGAKIALREHGVIPVGSGIRTLTWFEVPAPGAAFHVLSGTYPELKRKAPGATPKTHACMNHDSSRLDGAKSPVCHEEGPVPASKSVAGHQAVAVDTASWASAEWIRKVEEDPTAHAAVELARAAGDAKFENEATAVALLSCAAEHWDGKNGALAGVNCSSFNLLGKAMLTLGVVPSLPASIPTVHDELWRAFAEHDILEHLVVGFGDESKGQYQFAKP